MTRRDVCVEQIRGLNERIAEIDNEVAAALGITKGAIVDVGRGRKLQVRSWDIGWYAHDDGSFTPEATVVGAFLTAKGAPNKIARWDRGLVLDKKLNFRTPA